METKKENTTLDFGFKKEYTASLERYKKLAAEEKAKKRAD